MGRGRLTLVAVCLFAAATLLTVTVSGQARVRHARKLEVQRADSVALLGLGKQRGYEAALYMPNRRVVLLYTFRHRKLRGDSYVAMYNLYAVHNRGNLNRGEVRARFGSMGSVSLRFRPRGPTRTDEPPPGCEGGPTTMEDGRFVGHLRFRGQAHYFDFSSSGGGAFFAHSPRRVCERGDAAEPQPRSLRKYVAPIPLLPDRYSIALLYASTRSHGRYVGITAVHPERSPPGADVQLGVVEPRHGMAIGHGVYLDGPRGTLLTSLPGVHPATAKLALPPPFFGEATYSEEANAWTGDLGVRLAGVKVPLTGRNFGVHLCVANPLRDKDGCEFFKTEPPPDERQARPGVSR
jgi:hypothetical protein